MNDEPVLLIGSTEGCAACADEEQRGHDGMCNECREQRWMENIARFELRRRRECLRVLGEVIAAAIEAERLAKEYGWERCTITVHTVADWDEATQKWVMR